MRCDSSWKDRLAPPTADARSRHHHRLGLAGLLRQTIAIVGSCVHGDECHARVDLTSLWTLAVQVLRGSEPVAAAAASARSWSDRLDPCTCTDWVPPMYYGTIIFAPGFDHMPHLHPVVARVMDPRRVRHPPLGRSLHNVSHASVFVNRGMSGEGHHRPTGVLHDTRVCLFTRRSAARLVAGAGFTPVAPRRYRVGRFARPLGRPVPGGGESLMCKMFRAVRPLPVHHLAPL